MIFSDSFEFTCPIKTNSGNKALEQLPVELDALNAKRPMIITGKELVSKCIIKTFTRAFGDSGMTIGIFDGVTKNPDWKLIDELKKVYNEKKYDSIIALGSGVIIDVAKVLNIAVSQNVDVRKIAKNPTVKGPLKPFVIVPTATGSGVETSRFAHFQGMVFSSFYLMPALIILDPRMTRAKSKEEMVAAALAAFARSVEAYTAKNKNPLTDAYSYAAIGFIAGNLATAVKRPCNKKSALAIANAVAMSGTAMSNTAAGLISNLGQALVAMFQLPYGIGMGICLPQILAYYQKKGGYNIAQLLLPLAGPDVYAATPDSSKADKALTIVGGMIKELYETVGNKIPKTLKAAGVPQYMIEDILEKLSLADDAAFDKEGYLTVIESAWEGKPAASAGKE
jgi:alcohol dehydrogenase